MESDAKIPLAREWNIRRSGSLWTAAYTLLWLNLTLLAWLVFWPRLGAEHTIWSVVVCAGWAFGLGALAFFVNDGRVLLHDLLISITPREKVLLGMLAIGIWIAPAFFKNFYVMLDGPLCAATYLLLLGARPATLRACLGMALLGGFMAAWRIGFGIVEIILLAGFCWSWLAALGAVHFAWLGEPHGVPAGWAARRVLLNATLAACAGAPAAALAWWVWPAGGLHPKGMRGAHPLGMPPLQQNVLEHLGELDLARLIWLGLMTLILTGIALAVLIYLRRWFLRHYKGGTIMELASGQVSRLEYEQAPETPRAPQLEGLRGRIVALWAHWAAVLEREGTERHPAETARQFAERLAREQNPEAPSPDMTRLLEWAHYAREEPTEAEAGEMEELVERELQRLQTRRDTINHNHDR